MDSPTLHVEPVSPVSKEEKSRGHLKGIVIGVCVIVLLCVAGFVSVYLSGRTMQQIGWGTLSLPADLRNAQYVGLGQDGHSTRYSLNGIFFMSQAEIPYGSFYSVAVADSSADVVMTGPDYGLYLNGKNVATSSLPIVSVALSADATQILYSVAASSTIPYIIPGQGYDVPLLPSEWRMVLAYPRTGASGVFGAGLAPVFLDDDHVAWIADRGLYSKDLASGKETLLAPLPPKRVLAPALQSPDRSLYALRPTSSKVAVYRVTADTAQLVTTLSIGSSTAIALGNQSLYVLRGRSLWQFELKDGDTGRKVGSLPASLGIVDVTIPSP